MSVMPWRREDIKPLHLSDHAIHREALSDFIGPLTGVRFVAIGTSSYGSEETEKLRNQITKHLLESEGFNALVLEAACAPCEDINDYVIYGRGDATELIRKTGYWIWDSTNTLDMIDWIRMQNTSREAREALVIHGMDIKPIRFSIQRIRDYLGNLFIKDKQILIEVFEHIENLDVSVGWDRRKVSPTIAYRLLGFLVVHEKALVSASSRRAYDTIMHHAKNIFRFADAISAENSLQQRYIYMKDNLDYIIKQVGEESRVVIWSSNMNIVRSPEANIIYGGVAQDVSLGSLMSEAYGRAFFSVACCFDQGSFRSREASHDMRNIGEVKTYSIGPAPSGYLENSLAKVGVPVFGVNLRRCLEEDDTFPDIVRDLVMLRSFRSAYSPSWARDTSHEAVQNVDLGVSYDALAFVKRSGVSRGLVAGVSKSRILSD